ncbi:MAG: hypothetical protein R3F61_12625 [Myxococcota bacterium]
MSIGRWLRQVRSALDARASEPVRLPWGPPTTDWPRNAGLESALRRHPRNPVALSIYADWLMEEGDVRGSVLAAALAGQTEAAVWGARYLTPGAALEGWMLGPFAETLEIGPRHADRLQHEPFAYPACAITRTLRMFAPPAAAARILEARQAPCPIEQLVVGVGFEGLEPVWATLGDIRELRVEKARDLGAIRAPRLESLALGSVARAAWTDLASASLPALQSLELAEVPDDPGPAFSAAITALPVLGALHVRRTASAGLVQRLVEGGAGARVRTLTLPGARLDAVHALMHRADDLPALEQLTLPAMTRAADRRELVQAFGGRIALTWTPRSVLLAR